MIVTRGALIAALAAQLMWPQGIIRLKTRTITPVVSPRPIRPGRPKIGVARHYLVLFGSYPGPDVLADLAARHIVVDAYVPENALMVSAVSLNLRGLDVLWAAPMDPADKISPAVQASSAYLVILQPDTDSAQDQAEIESVGFSVLENPYLLAHQVLVAGAFSGLPALADLDEVAYILPASVELQSGAAVLACPGPLTSAGPTAQYVAAGHGWSKDGNGRVGLQYFIDSLTPDVAASVARSEIARAFAAWAEYGNINITAAGAAGEQHGIDVLFARYAHGDAYPFNGPNGVLAHTFYPVPGNPEPIAGDIHLNSDVSWSVGGKVDLFSVVLHEAGHALGLGHSDNPSSVMYPYYRQDAALTADDIAGIQALYGAKSTSGDAPPTGTGSSGSTGSGGGSGSASGTGSGAGTKIGADTVAPFLTIVSPASSIVSTAASSIVCSGTAGDNVALASVQWTTSTGAAGTAAGTTAWSAAIPLLIGSNTVTVRAYDAAGNTAWRTVTVVRQ